MYGCNAYFNQIRTEREISIFYIWLLNTKGGSTDLDVNFKLCLK